MTSERTYDDRIRLSAAINAFNSLSLSDKRKDRWRLHGKLRINRIQAIYVMFTRHSSNRGRLLSFLFLSFPSVVLLPLSLRPSFISQLLFSCFFLFPLPSYSVFTFLSLCFTAVFTFTRLFLFPLLFTSDCLCSMCTPTQSQRGVN